MNEEQFKNLLAVLQGIEFQLKRIADCKEETGEVETPDIRTTLDRFTNFDWESIGAQVLASDEDGATMVSWRNKTYSRRSPQNKFESAIWYSRCTGKNPDGTNIYERLITFKEAAEVDPLPRKVANLVTVSVAPANVKTDTVSRVPQTTQKSVPPTAAKPEATPARSTSAETPITLVPYDAIFSWMRSQLASKCGFQIPDTRLQAFYRNCKVSKFTDLSSTQKVGLIKKICQTYLAESKYKPSASLHAIAQRLIDCPSTNPGIVAYLQEFVKEACLCAYSTPV